tara:strand:- start:282 stop:1175 length:894 start_codon:yes stop_codon:yes gene_type:complete
MDNYFDQIKEQINKVTKILKKKGIQEELLNFDANENLDLKIRPPTDANSEFLANRAMGDWAENLIINQVNSDKKYIALRYGNEETISAGEEGFKDFYISLKKEVLKFGKRPDLLIFDKNYNKEKNLSNLNTLDAKEYVEECLTSIEIRSSKFESEVYKKVRQKEKMEGKSVQRTSLGFTVKVEDLKIVYRWIKNHKKPQSYFQIFFDKVYGINFIDILNLIISEKKEIKIESPLKSQLKTTIVIPVDFGYEIATVTEKPKIVAIQKITKLGRHDFYVKPQGGKVEINYLNFEKVLLI